MKKIIRFFMFASIVILLSACSENNVYSVRFIDSDNSTISEQDVTSGEDAMPPSPPIIEGFKFVEWDRSYQNIREDLIVKAIYERKDFEVIFLDHEGNILKKSTVEFGSDVIAPDALEIEGKEFVKWDQSFIDVTNDMTIQPVYVDTVHEVNLYNSNNSLLKTLQITHGGILESLNEYEPRDYEALWFEDNEDRPITFPLAITESLTLYLREYSKGLEFQRYNNGYSVSHGEADDEFIIIPSHHQNLPVIAIERYGFSNRDLSKVFIPYTVEIILDRAFESTLKLDQVIFEENSNLKIIGFDGFAKTEALIEIDLPEGLTTLDQGAFYLSGIEIIELPSTLRNIGPYALSHAFKLTQINVDQANANYSSVDGVLYTGDLKKLVILPSAYDAKEYEIINTTEILLGGSLEGVRLETLTIPKSLNTINSYGFSGSQIENVFFPDGTNEQIDIEQNAFNNSNPDMKIYIEDSDYDSSTLENSLTESGNTFEIYPLSSWATTIQTLTILNNSWIVEDDLVIEENVRVFDDWRNVNENEYVYTYFFLRDSGSLNLIFNFPSNLDQVVEIHFNNEVREVNLNTIDGEYNWGFIINVSEGHHVVKFRIVSANSMILFKLDDIILEGSAVDNGLDQIPPNETQMAASLHLWPQVSNEFGDIEWLYSEILIEDGNDILYTYFVANGFAEGYFGIQTNKKNIDERWVLFSVWSSYDTDDPNQIPEDLKVRLVEKGENVVFREFGSEGSGGQSYLEHPWETGQKYKFLTRVNPVGNNKTQYSSYFYDPLIDEWLFIATLERPNTNTYAKNWYQFIEVYLENYGNIERTGHYGNYWVRNTEEEWHSVNSAYLTATNNARLGYRNDIHAGISRYDGMFYLTTGGFNVDPIEIDRTLFIETIGEEPVIDFDLLP